MTIYHILKVFTISLSLGLMVADKDKWATYVLLAYMAFHY